MAKKGKQHIKNHNRSNKRKRPWRQKEKKIGAQKPREKKIPHTGDTESLDRCGSQERYFFLRGGMVKKKEKKREKK